MFPPLIGLLLFEKTLHLFYGKGTVFDVFIIAKHLECITAFNKIGEHGGLLIAYLCLLYHIAVYIEKKKLVHFAFFTTGVEKQHLISGASVNIYFIFFDYYKFI